jgi:hypothetical protein
MRIRQIKPEFWKDDKVGQLTAHQKLLFIGLWMLADGEGRLYNRHVIIKAELFAYDDKLTLKQVESDLVRLHDLGLILLYQAEGKQCIVINNFHKHQKLSGNENKDFVSDIPAPVTTDSDLVATDSSSVTFSSTESVNPSIRKSDTPSIRKEGEKQKKIPIAKPDDVSQQVWGEWVAYRATLKAPVSETVLKGLRREGDKAGISLEQVLETCLTNAWRGFQAEWYLKNKPKEPLGSNGLPLSHASNINEKHREAKVGDFTQDDWDKLMKTGKYAQ